MTRNQEALRTVAIFLRLQALGVPTLPEESKRMSDLCFLMLPAKYRLSRKNIEDMEKQAVYEQDRV